MIKFNRRTILITIWLILSILISLSTILGRNEIKFSLSVIANENLAMKLYWQSYEENFQEKDSLSFTVNKNQKDYALTFQQNLANLKSLRIDVDSPTSTNLRIEKLVIAQKPYRDLSMPATYRFSQLQYNPYIKLKKNSFYYQQLQINPGDAFFEVPIPPNTRQSTSYNLIIKLIWLSFGYWLIVAFVYRGNDRIDKEVTNG